MVEKWISHSQLLSSYNIEKKNFPCCLCFQSTHPHISDRKWDPTWVRKAVLLRESKMACVTLKRSLDFDPLHSPSRPIKRRRYLFRHCFSLICQISSDIHRIFKFKINIRPFSLPDVSPWASPTVAAPARGTLASAALLQSLQVSNNWQFRISGDSQQFVRNSQIQPAPSYESLNGLCWSTY